MSAIFYDDNALYKDREIKNIEDLSKPVFDFLSLQNTWTEDYERQIIGEVLDDLREDYTNKDLEGIEGCLMDLLEGLIRTIIIKDHRESNNPYQKISELAYEITAGLTNPNDHSTDINLYIPYFQTFIDEESIQIRIKAGYYYGIIVKMCGIDFEKLCIDLKEKVERIIHWYKRYL